MDDLTTGRAPPRSLSPYQVTTSRANNRTNRELKLLKFLLRRVLPESFDGSVIHVLHIGEGSGYHVASLARAYPHCTFIPTDKDLTILQEGLRYFHNIVSLGTNMQPAQRLTTQGFSGCDCAACEKDRSNLGLVGETLDVVIANRVGDPGSKPFYIDDMLKGAGLHLKPTGLIIGGYWPLHLEKDSLAIRHLLEYVEQQQPTSEGFPLEKVGQAAAELTKRSNKVAAKYGMRLEVVVHSLSSDCTTMCMFRKTVGGSNTVHVFPWTGHGNIVIQVDDSVDIDVTVSQYRLISSL